MFIVTFGCIGHPHTAGGIVGLSLASKYDVMNDVMLTSYSGSSYTYTNLYSGSVCVIPKLSLVCYCAPTPTSMEVVSSL